MRLITRENEQKKTPLENALTKGAGDDENVISTNINAPRQGLLTKEWASRYIDDMELFKDIEQQLREIHDPALDDYDARIESKLGTRRRTAEALERITRETVEEARQLGSSWSEIGEALGISKQAAHQRFKNHIREIE